MLIHEQPTERRERRILSVHLVADRQCTIAELRGMLTPHYAVTSAMLGSPNSANNEFDFVIIAADLKIVENIAALKDIFPTLKTARKKIFLADPKARLLVFQAYALGATRVIPHPLIAQSLLAVLADSDKPAVISSGEAAIGAQQAASAGA
jgi:hypothetical protein